MGLVASVGERELKLDADEAREYVTRRDVYLSTDAGRTKVTEYIQERGKLELPPFLTGEVIPKGTRGYLKRVIQTAGGAGGDETQAMVLFDQLPVEVDCDLFFERYKPVLPKKEWLGVYEVVIGREKTTINIRDPVRQ